MTRLACLASLSYIMMTVAAAPLSSAEGQANASQGLIHYWSFDRAKDNGQRDNAGDIRLRNPY